jgi:uncharacterized protein
VIFVDSSAWFAAVNRRDRHHLRAVELLASAAPLATSHFIIVETWLLINSRIDFATAERFVHGVGRSDCTIVQASSDDWLNASAVSALFPDQTFSIVDRTSFVLMERLAVSQVISFDDDFIIYRYGGGRDRAFEVTR